ncbi:uncharacterized protein LOC128884273 isoform X2 [Hylaeus volcanicus]|uniref:uncharacterized protein LOC128884273 isoform X2 n=1 Tax=Hylaeus volcanicus TaxID=313075 RepID=UPI0023B7FE20|nr:uncharacterized protein LOC128884273 isoform X2 [Hylaeus volcanicus]
MTEAQLSSFNNVDDYNACTPSIYQNKFKHIRRPFSYHLRKTLTSAYFDNIQNSNRTCISDYFLNENQERSPNENSTLNKSYRKYIHMFENSERSAVVSMDDNLVCDDFFFLNKTPTAFTTSSFPETLSTNIYLGSREENSYKSALQSPDDSEYQLPYLYKINSEECSQTARNSTDYKDAASTTHIYSETQHNKSKSNLCSVSFLPLDAPRKNNKINLPMESISWTNMKLTSEEFNTSYTKSLSPSYPCEWSCNTAGNNTEEAIPTPFLDENLLYSNVVLHEKPTSAMDLASIRVNVSSTATDVNLSTNTPPTSAEDNSNENLGRKSSLYPIKKQNMEKFDWIASTSTTRSSSLCFPHKSHDNGTFSMQRNTPESTMSHSNNNDGSCSNLKFLTEPSMSSLDSTTANISRPLEIELNNSMAIQENHGSPTTNSETLPKHMTTKDYLISLKSLDVLSFAKSQTGSRRLQSLLYQNNKEITTYIFKKTCFNLTELMIDLYGNYFCQELFQACSLSQRILFLQNLSPDIRLIASNPRGTHAMQAVVILMKPLEEQQILIQQLHEHLFYLATHPFGTHVIQQTLTYFHPQATAVMFEYIVENVTSLADHPHGVCVVKRVISIIATTYTKNKYFSTLQQTLRDKLSASTLPLSQSPFGNYAIQHAIQTWGTEFCFSIISQLHEHIVELASQKFSSNVVEQMLGVVGEDKTTMILKNMTSSNNIQLLTNSVYGNFVVKKAFEQSSKTEAKVILPIWVDHINFIQNKRLKAKWDKTLYGIKALLESHD